MKRSGSDARDAAGDGPSLGSAGDAARARLAEAVAAATPGSTLAAALASLAQAIAALERSAVGAQVRLRSVLDAVPDAVTVHDAAGRILDANHTACALYGHPLDALRRMGVRDLNPDLPEAHMADVWRTLRLGQTFTVETTNIHADGHRFPVEVRSNAYEVDGEKRIVAVARDITLRQQADAAQRQSEERYRRLLDAVDKGILVQDTHRRILSANAAAARFLGVPVEELLAVGLDPARWSVVDEHGRPIDVERLPGVRALRTGQVVESTLIGVRRHDGLRVRWYTVTSVPQFLPGEATPFQVISVFGDVTDLKRQSEQFEQTQAIANIGGFELHFADDLVHASAAVQRLLDLPRADELPWSTVLAAFAPADARQLADAVARARRDGESFDLELRVAPRARRRWLRVLGRPFAHDAGVLGITGTLQDVTLRRTQDDQLRRQALTDTLTGLANRDALLRALTGAIDDAPPGRGPALLYIDLDRFKVINDLLGHGAGDGLLVAAAQRLKDIAGSDALVARFGGDEFMIVLPWRDDDGAPQRLAERITVAFARPFEYATEEFTITTSVGVAQFPADGATIQQLINHADAAMFEAKRRGRNKWQPFSPQLARTLTDRLLVETQLRRALDNDEFHLVYQPQVDLATGALLGAETLLRWRNRLLGEMSPAVFVNHAEVTGDIVRIGEWVIRESCRQMRRWQADGVVVPRIAVNVSYRQFRNEGLVDVVRSALAESGLPGDALEIEITERVLVEESADTSATFAALRALGVHLVIDDFGEGYSALSYLRQFPFNGLKIGHKFMQGVPENPADATICQAIIGIAQSLGLVVIAEGVEHERQRRFLIAHGARNAQGFLFSRPVGADEVAAYAQRFPHVARAR